MTATTKLRPRRDRRGVSAMAETGADMASTLERDRPADAEPTFGLEPTEPFTPLTEQEIAEVEERARESLDHWDRVYEGLKTDARSCARSMSTSPLLGNNETFDEIVGRSLDDYLSGRSLMDHMGADRLIDPALTGMLLAMRRGLVEEIHSPTMAEFMLIDTAVIAFANAMRMQSIVGNTALILESELFGQPTLRARWKKQYGGRPEDIRDLAADEHVERLRERIMPVIEKFNRMGGDAVNALRRQREAPSARVERSRPLDIRVVGGTRGSSTD